MTKNKTRRVIKRLLPWLITLILLAALVVFVFIPIYTKSDSRDLPQVVLRSNSDVEKQYTLENDELLFTLDGMTTQFTLQNKRTGQVWRSNPEGADSDPIALPAEKSRMKSTLLLTYATSDGATTLFDNYNYSISNSVYDIDTTEDSVRVNYVIGKLSRVFFVPDAITKARMDVFTDGMSKRETGTVLDMYQLYDPENKKDAGSIAELVETYPDMANEPVYVMRPKQKDNKKSKVEALLAEHGYNEEEYALDQSRIVGESAMAGAVFNVTLEYRLDGGDLVLQVPYSQIRYSADYPIINITPLPYFGAAGTDTEGYTVVPEGGGSIIRFNNGKNSQTAYYSNIYGWDYGTARTAVINETRSAFPVYAMAVGDSGFVCMVEQGAAVCGINADVSGRNNSVNTASVTYTVLHNDQYQVSAKTVQRIYMFENAMPDITATQRYRFVDSGSYVELARAYGDYLQQRAGLTPTTRADAPVVISLVGAIEKTVKRAGIPLTDSVALTTFDEAGAMLDELGAAGLYGLDVRYEGWANGGISQRVFTSVKVENELGGWDGLKRLSDSVQSAGSQLYLDGMNMFTYRSGIFQGFNYFTDAAKYTTRDRIKLYPYSAIFFTQEKYRDSFYFAKPGFIQRMAANFQSAAGDLGCGVSYRDMGYLLGGDYDSESITTREQAAAQQSAIMAAAQQAGSRVMVRNGNDYALGNCDVICEMDLFGTQYSILDEDIPFYQIALHGLVDYASQPLNMVGDRESVLLRSAEYGAGLSYTFMARDADILVDTYYTQYTGATWSAARDDAIAILTRYREATRGLNDKRINDHRYITPDVTCTEFEGGARVYVNFGYEDFAQDGIAVPARDYIVLREGSAK